ncbi:MAG: N-(5'-phosphoribosyl)anthranilate isomerase [Pseudomonadota bacterium]
MSSLPFPYTSDEWLRHVFASKAVQEGTIIRRKVRDIERIVGRDRFEAELRRRGFQAVENAGQLVIFCNREPLRRIL